MSPSAFSSRPEHRLAEARSLAYYFLVMPNRSLSMRPLTRRTNQRFAGLGGQRGRLGLAPLVRLTAGRMADPLDHRRGVRF